MKLRTRRHTRLTWLIALVAVFALFAASCGSSDDEEAEPTDTGATETTQATSSDDDGSDDMSDTPAVGDGSLGTVVVAEGEAIQIRSLNAISGEVAFLGLPIQYAVEQAIADYGPIRGFDVDMGTGLDDLCSAEGGQAAAQQIAADEQVVGVIGTSCSGAAVAAAPVITGAGMVMISASNTAPGLTSDLAGNEGADHVDGYFRTAHNDLVQGAAVAEFVYNELNITSAASLHDGDPYTVGLTGAFNNAFEGLGGTVTDTVGIGKEDTDMTPALTELATGSPGAIFFPIFQPAGDYVADQVTGVSGLENVARLAADGLLTDPYLELPQTKDMYFSGPDLRFGANRNEATGVSADEFLATYEVQRGEAPTAAFWAHSYDAATLLLEAINAASAVNADGQLVIDRQGVRQALHDTSGFAGILGTLNCDEFGDCGASKITVIQNTGDDIEAAKTNIVYSYEGS